MCPGLYLFQIETGQSWDLFPCVCQLCLGPLGSSKAPASCFAKARPRLGLVWHSLWCPGTKPRTFPIGAHDRVGSLDIPQQGSEAYSYSQPVLVPENRAAGGLRYSWGLSVNAVPRPFQRTSPPTPGPGSCLLLCLPSLFLPACAPWVSLASPKCSLLSTSHERDLLPCRRAAGWHLQAAGCFTSLYFWLLLTSYFLQ